MNEEMSDEELVELIKSHLSSYEYKVQLFDDTVNLISLAFTPLDIPYFDEGYLSYFMDELDITFQGIWVYLTGTPEDIAKFIKKYNLTVSTSELIIKRSFCKKQFEFIDLILNKLNEVKNV